MNLTIVGQSLVITSSLKKETIERAGKFAPKSLQLIKGEGDNKEILCTLGVAKTAGVSARGINFDTADKNGLAQATIMLPGVKAAERETWVKENYGMAFVNAAAIEAQVIGELAAFDKTMSEIKMEVAD